MGTKAASLTADVKSHRSQTSRPRVVTSFRDSLRSPCINSFSQFLHLFRMRFDDGCRCDLRRRCPRSEVPQSACSRFVRNQNWTTSKKATKSRYSSRHLMRSRYSHRISRFFFLYWFRDFPMRGRMRKASRLTRPGPPKYSPKNADNGCKAYKFA